jgi:hypothetical protein
MISWALFLLTTSVAADDLIPKLVSDVKANPQQYLSYIQTATASIPADLTPLALQVRTYTDDSFTTLLDSSEKSELLAFATGLPWYSSRLLDDSNSTDEASSSTETSSSSVSASASESSGNAGNLVVPGLGLAALAVVLM